ncbi:NADH dehydrogenase [ubiquinone] 1 alpha subcomplex subunit 7-like [Saccoglossus kowalevskii]|uniref:NADH dehydrogenase [ubiquinone] 1 alpha subcomplex subunit 7 n=1 Tax=Saccoglossus kowalevskii TaxID=10224 RepID=A0ABM0GLF1_SACKO|nr:PREDICTED: NADH dehydrogenase [ubiquinone] 1 alpha subcomplex subunit 7-like [Saccoglossus kowalevskii]
MAVATKYVKWLRNFFAGRDYQGNLPLRYARDQAPRTIPPANLPDGPSHAVASNYYFSRDARRLNSPPDVLYSQVKQLPAPAASGPSSVPANRSTVTPGKALEWNISKDQPYL